MNKSSFDSGSRPIYHYILENNLTLALDIYNSTLFSEIVDEVGLLENYFAIFAIEDSSLDGSIAFENRTSVCHFRILEVEDCTFSAYAISESIVSSCNIFVDILIHTETINSNRQARINIGFSECAR